jgi:Mn2+/Fe2+ NRAMP family transporter
VFLLLSLVFIAYPVAAVLGHPHVGTVISNTALPHFLANRDFLFLAVAIVGTTITPYMQLYQAAAVADRGIGPDDYADARIDSITGSIFANVVSMAIIIATAATIGGTGPLQSAKQAAQALKPIAGQGAEVLFGLGLLGASALAAAVVPLATAYAVAEAVGAERSTSRSFREAPLFGGLFTALIVVGASVALLPGDLIKLLINMQIINGLVAPVILVFILTLANRRSVLGDAVNGSRFNVVATVSVVAVAVLAAVVAFEAIGSAIGL